MTVVVSGDTTIAIAKDMSRIGATTPTQNDATFIASADIATASRSEPTTSGARGP
jgi:hypothetical protein